MIPDYQTLMLPLLKFAGDHKEHSIRETIDHISSDFKLTDEEKNELLPSGQQGIIDNRVGWARTYLKKAGLLESTRRSFFKITQRGLDVLKENPPNINVKYLEKYLEFIEFKTLKKDDAEEQFRNGKEITAQTPLELLEYSYQSIRQNLSRDLLNQVKQCSPKFFENLVVELLLKMGYGGSLKDAGKAIGQSGDGGIDGIIKEDRLGLDVIYIQAKRWENVVGAKEVRNFVGSLVGQKANKGVFITTSSFTNDALQYVTTIQHKVVLIDGETLAQFMIDNNVGVFKINSYDIKKIDSDYFIEE